MTKRGKEEHDVVKIRHLCATDSAFWYRLDRHLPKAEFEDKVRTGRGYVLLLDDRPAALLRYNLFWDSIPFCTLLVVEEACRRQGYGQRLLLHWEEEMKAMGYGLLMTSTQVDEQAQHFYRKMGYRDCGGLLLDVPGYAQPMELFMLKAVEKPGRSGRINEGNRSNG